MRDLAHHLSLSPRAIAPRKISFVPPRKVKPRRLSSVVAIISRSRARPSAEPPLPIVMPTANDAILEAIQQR
jgi:hypothetical protein